MKEVKLISVEEALEAMDKIMEADKVDPLPPNACDYCGNPGRHYDGYRDGEKICYDCSFSLYCATNVEPLY